MRYSKLAQGTASTATNYNDESAARSAVMAALGQTDDSTVEAEARDTDATETAADDVDDSEESAEEAEETTEEDSKSDDEEPKEVEAKGEEETDSPFNAEDRAAIKADPKLAKLAKGLQKSYTQKMQELGEVSKFQKMIQGDPKTVLQRIAEANGLKVNFDGDKAASTALATGDITDPVAAAIEAQRAEWLPILGEGATTAMLKGIQRVAEAITGSKVEPIVKGNTAREQAVLQVQVNEEFSRFTKEFPDWKTHEAAMLELKDKINPNMGTYDTAKFLYDNVTKGKQIAKAKTEAETKLAAKVKRSAADAEPAPRTRIPGGKVTTPPHAFKSAEDAVKAALAEQGYTDF